MIDDPTFMMALMVRNVVNPLRVLVPFAPVALLVDIVVVEVDFSNNLNVFHCAVVHTVHSLLGV